MKNSTVALLRDALKMRVYMDYTGVQHLKRRYEDEPIEKAQMKLNGASYTLTRFPNGIAVVEDEAGAVSAGALLHTLDGVLAFNATATAQEFVDRYGAALNVLAFWSDTFETIYLIRYYTSVEPQRNVSLVYDTWMWCNLYGELRLTRQFVELDQGRFIIRPYYKPDSISYVHTRKNATITDAILYDKWENARVILESELFEPWLL